MDRVESSTTMSSICNKVNEINLRVSKGALNYCNFLYVNEFQVFLIVIFFPTRKKISFPATLLLTSELTIERVLAFKYLGLTVNENLRWHVYINNLERKLACAYGILRGLRTTLPFHTKKLIYATLLQSHMNFMSHDTNLGICVVNCTPKRTGFTESSLA